MTSVDVLDPAGTVGPVDLPWRSSTFRSTSPDPLGGCRPVCCSPTGIPRHQDAGRGARWTQAASRRNGAPVKGRYGRRSSPAVPHGHPRDYTQRTPKKMKTAALRGALSDRARMDACTWSRLCSEDVPPRRLRAALAAVGVEGGC